MKTIKKAIWLSYDLGAQGDYESLYKWLDNLQAIECGNSVAFFYYNIRADYTDIGLIETLKNDIKSHVQITNRSRFYVVWRNIETSKASGKFIIGKIEELVRGKVLAIKKVVRRSLNDKYPHRHRILVCQISGNRPTS